MKFTKLNNGITIPSLGFGTWQITDEETCITAVKTAIEAGYTHIDTAAIYKNEESVGKGIKASGAKREDLFIVTKVWNDDRGYENTLKAFETSLEKLGLDYIDLYLIHWPKKENVETWKALEELYKEGKVKAIGVCNFNKHHIEEIIDNCNIKPMINQIELHPGFPQVQLKEYCEKNKIAVEAWSPLSQGTGFDNEVVTELAKKYNKTSAQIILRWHLQFGTIAIPKSATPSRIKQNFDIFDFELTNKEVNSITNIAGERMGPDPDNFDF